MYQRVRTRPESEIRRASRWGRVRGGQPLPRPESFAQISEEAEALHFCTVSVSYVERAAGVQEVLQVGVDLQGLVDGVGLGVAGKPNQAVQGLHASRCEVHRHSLEPGAANTAAACGGGGIGSAPGL